MVARMVCAIVKSGESDNESLTVQTAQIPLGLLRDIRSE